MANSSTNNAVRQAEQATTPASVSHIGHWPANLELQFARGARGTRLVRNRHQGPLYVQRPFYPEGPDLPHAYLLHPPGGIVSGDRLQVKVQMEANARALLTTPGAGRVYRARPDRALQHQINVLRIDAGASLEWLPLETIVFPDARTRLETRVELQGDARFIGWEVTSLGLPACEQHFDRGELSQRFSVHRDGIPMVLEQLRLDDQHRKLYQSAAGMRSQPINGLFVAGPFAASDLQENQMEALRQLPEPNGRDYIAGISLTGEFALGRYLGSCSEQARLVFEYWWQQLRPVLLQREACRPRIWFT
ncbi:urease accessory protein UreD [Pseudomaricurvus alkylphenolicus]|uniref:urease accessory protein UreD n=1 Tax=Pseudomaricurvus alkylphenolicus TaxID=1306991 RepID=UPI00197ECE5F